MYSTIVLHVPKGVVNLHQLATVAIIVWCTCCYPRVRLTIKMAASGFALCVCACACAHACMCVDTHACACI